MPFSEKADLKAKDERRPLLRDPVWHYNHRYGRGRGYDDPEELDELLGRDSARNQRFQWMLFLGVTFLSVLILLATMGLLINLSQTHPSEPKGPTTTPPPFSNMPASPTPSSLPKITSSIPSPSTTPSIFVYVNDSSPLQSKSK